MNDSDVRKVLRILCKLGKSSFVRTTNATLDDKGELQTTTDNIFLCKLYTTELKATDFRELGEIENRYPELNTSANFDPTASITTITLTESLPLVQKVE